MQAGQIFLQQIANDLFGGDYRQATEWYLNMSSNPQSVQQRMESLEKQMNTIRHLLKDGSLSQEEREEYEGKLKALEKEYDYLSTISNREDNTSQNALIAIADEAVTRAIGQDRKKIEEPEADRESIVKATRTAEEEGTSARGAEVRAPNQNPEHIYRSMTIALQSEKGNLTEEYEKRKQANDIQADLYQKYAENKDFMEFKAKEEKFKEDLEKLATLQGNKDEIKDKIDHLRRERAQVAKEVYAKERELMSDVSLLGKLNGNPEKIWELVTDENRLKQYEELVNSLSPWQRANMIDPDILKGMREKWLDILETRGYMHILDSAINQHKDNLDKVQEEIREQLKELQENREGYMATIAREMAEGKYQRYGTKVITGTEAQISKAMAEEAEDKSSSAPNPIRGGI